MTIARDSSSKPLAFLTNFSGTRRARTTAALSQNGVPVLSGTREGLHALNNLLEFRDFSYRPGNAAETGPQIDVGITGGEALQEHEALALLARVGIPTVTSRLINSRAELEQVEDGLDYPVVLKTAVTGIFHKTDAGGVVLDIADKHSLHAAYSDMSARLGARALVQPMVNKDRELLLGMKTDATFGPLVIVAAGGTLAEYFRDRAIFLPDAPEGEIIEKIRRLKIHRILQGVRGAPSVDLDALAAAVSSFARFCGAACGSISEIDINPLHVSPDGVLALDALIIPHGQNG